MHVYRIIGYHMLMSSTSDAFKKTAAIVIGFHGGIAASNLNRQIGETVIDVMGLAPDALTSAALLAFLAAGFYVGARIGYRGTYSLLSDSEQQGRPAAPSVHLAQ